MHMKGFKLKPHVFPRCFVLPIFFRVKMGGRLGGQFFFSGGIQRCLVLAVTLLIALGASPFSGPFILTPAATYSWPHPPYGLGSEVFYQLMVASACVGRNFSGVVSDFSQAAPLLNLRPFPVRAHLHVWYIFDVATCLMEAQYHGVVSGVIER
mmetsp:Transcript_37950/g.62986  ORF Transcript_37950/g.62986 Transcript_37950/m.62986 type:complete len:153 (-) Transcript_37950:8-466(-)